MADNEVRKAQLNKTTEIDLPKLDVAKYVGKKVKIERVDEMEGKFGYFINVYTAPIDTIKNRNGDTTDLRASKQFSLQQDANGNVGWGKDTNLGTYLAKMNCKHYKDLVGKEVIIQTNYSKEKKRDFLTFA